MTEVEMADKLYPYDQVAKAHPAWKSFVIEMQDKQYGQEPLIQAWSFYRSGWEAC